VAQHDDKQAERLNRELAKYQAFDEAEIREEIRDMLARPKGRKLLWWLLEVGGYGRNPFSTDALIMAMQCGEMNTGAALMARLIEVNPLGFAEMQLERKNESDRRDLAARNLAGGNDLFATGDDTSS